MFLAADHDDTRLKIQYELVAQYNPLNYKDWQDSTRFISKFRTTKLVFIYQPPRFMPDNPLSFTLTNKIGGLLGFGMTQCVTKVIFDRNEYYLGEEAVV